ncbi:MAG TPA: hypothetical protein PK597_00370 [Oscillospiraceae bacterium]|nr:hypothetical protein [Oscillospiraceae bacterium]
MPERDKPTREEIEQTLLDVFFDSMRNLVGKDAARGALFSARHFLKTNEAKKRLLLSLRREYAVMMVNKTLKDVPVRISYPELGFWVVSGSVRLNPCILCLSLAETRAGDTALLLSAYAKEGIIKQHTAETFLAQFGAKLQTAAGAALVSAEQTEGGGADAGA